MALQNDTVYQVAHILYRTNQLKARGLLEKYKRKLQDPLAFKTLSGEFDEGDVILVERGPEGLTFSVDTPVVEGEVVT